MSSEHLVVKVGHEGCIWRLKVPVQDVSYNKVKEVVGKTVSLEKGRVIRYKDDEGDMCVLTSETFDDAMDISLRDNGLLRLDVVTVSFIPLMIQRCSRHTDRLSYHVHKKYDCIRPTLQSMLLAITHIPELHEFMPLLQAIVNSGPNTPEVTEFGQWFVGLLKSFSTLSFDTQVQVLLMVAPSWIPCFRTAIQLGRFDVPPTPKQQVTHYGVECDGCGVNPIVGPRFKCQVCDYDLCGECYPNKSTIHAESHDFVCVLRSGREASGVKLGLLTKESPSSKLSAPTMLSAKASSLKCRTPAGEEEHKNYHWSTNG
ncbi:hypothetical protein Pmar_PMAR000107 [Perkinsus marinus ATCC 50983]|uniref:ZZ-type domain-containing protein n=1 Tax=Perkinsus marinus (strain ATCC 50983 / TXsc) TaxID=423536 RepID=C5KPX3_PERM5|nr:hypothetical protein Pmar_PMAR000107 [Perkinsus marinus ATCC 50983]EER13520.1 hypothetical protein Pmar_PMAR000107 [Perkinsus marinus ATCC 50983]|eukprot:XP_002781725.1 hypothetical protein Pmar_PMAR000107 [Perkinsus marinus ATCC 50983]